MNCREFQKHLDNLLCARPGDETLAEMTQHAGTCPQCARDYQAALETLDSVQLSHKVQPSSDLKERIMNGIVEIDNSGFNFQVLFPPAGEVPWRIHQAARGIQGFSAGDCSSAP